MFGNTSHVGRIAVIALFALVFTGMTASAADIDEIPQGLADATGMSILAAELVLSSCVLLSVGLAVSISQKGNLAMTVIIELAFVGMLTAIGWLDAWLLVMAALVIALMFGARLRNWGEVTFAKE